MSLSSAAYWIASKGGAFSFFVHDLKVWDAAYQKLLSKIITGEVRVIGRRRGNPLAGKVDGIQFSGIALTLFFDAFAREAPSFDVPQLYCAAPVTDNDWMLHNNSLRVYNDSICVQNQAELTHLQVCQNDVRRIWSFPDSSSKTFKGDANKSRNEPLKGATELTYKKWISECEGRERPPKIEEDIRHMRVFDPNITRDRVRKLRKGAPASWHEPGRPPLPR